MSLAANRDDLQTDRADGLVVHRVFIVQAGLHATTAAGTSPAASTYLPQRAPRALTSSDATRWLRTVEREAEIRQKGQPVRLPPQLWGRSLACPLG